MSSSITAIVNIFRREYVIEEQLQAINNQSIKPETIILWNNGNKNVDLTKYKNDPFYKVFDCNFNSGVWSRFIIGQLANTEYNTLSTYLSNLKKETLILIEFPEDLEKISS